MRWRGRRQSDGGVVGWSVQWWGGRKCGRGEGKAEGEEGVGRTGQKGSSRNAARQRQQGSAGQQCRRHAVQDSTLQNSNAGDTQCRTAMRTARSAGRCRCGNADSTQCRAVQIRQCRRHAVQDSSASRQTGRQAGVQADGLDTAP
jgi:hypothetical protein